MITLVANSSKGFLRVNEVWDSMRRLLVNVNSWTIAAALIITLLFLPNLAIVSGVFSPSNENWEHIKEFVLYKYLQTSLILVSVTAVLTILIGLSLAWLIAQYQFPLRNFLKWALILPLIHPAFHWSLYVSRHRQLYGDHSKDSQKPI